MRWRNFKKWKCRICALTAALMVLTGLPVSGSVNVVEAESPASIYTENFENAAYMTATSATELAASMGYLQSSDLEADGVEVAVVAEEGNTDNHVLKVSTTNGNKFNLIYNWSETPKKVVLKYRIKPESITENGTIIVRTTNDPVYLLDNTKIEKETFVFGANNTQAGEITSGWNDVEIVVDTTRNKYDVYLNNTRVLSEQGVEHVGVATAITYFIIRVYSGPNAWYIDDISISEDIPEYVPCTSVSFDNAPAELSVGQTYKLTMNAEPEGAFIPEVEFTSSDSEVATVDNYGNVSALATGTVTITATPAQGQAATTSITVKNQELGTGFSYTENFENAEYLTAASATELAASMGYLESPDLEADGVEVAVEAEEGNPDNHVLKVSTTNGNKFNLIYNWSETPKKVVLKYRIKPESITENGTIIVRTTNDPVYLLDNTKIEKETFVFGANNTQAGEITSGWNDVEIVVDTTKNKYDVYLNNTRVLSEQGVENVGVATAITHFIIRVYSGPNAWYIDDISISEDIPEYVPCTSVSFDNAPAELSVGQTYKLTMNAEPEGAFIPEVEFTSSDSEVATVDNYGNVSALATGTVTITATSAQGQVATTSITVKEPDIILENVTDGAVSLPVGGHMYIDAVTSPIQAPLSYSSDDEAVATVDEWGEIVAVGEGTATITVQVETLANVTETFTVTVGKADVEKTTYIYVSPTGSSTGLGTENDKVSIQRAMELVAEKNDNMAGNIEVVMDGGYYGQTSTIAFTEAHGATNNYAVIWRSADGEEVIIGGGIHIAGSEFTACTETGLEGVYVVNIAEGIQTRQLYVNNVRATRARSEGSLKNPKFDKSFGYICDNIELLTYNNIADLELVWYQNWTNSRCGVASVELTADERVKVTMENPGWEYVTEKGSQTSTSTTTEIAWFENALELLDEPGEWYLDEVNNKLYYMPRQWETMENVVVTVPVVEELVTVTGTDIENVVENIRFEGITFADTTWVRPSTAVGHVDIQNSIIRTDGSFVLDKLPDGTIVVKRANSISFTDCTFTRMGTIALKMVDGVQNSQIRDNHFYDISGSAIAIGEPACLDDGLLAEELIENYYPEDIRKVMKNCDVVNNYIHDVAVDYMSAAAVSVGFAANMDLSYNEIFNIPYSAIHIGYGWAIQFNNVLKNMVISHNVIHNVLNDKVYDGGAIYVLGNTGDGDGSYNLVTDNYIKNQMNSTSPLYADNGSTYWNFENNVVDLSEVNYWAEKATAMRWAHVNEPSYHVHFKNNYATVEKGSFDQNTNDVSIEPVILCDAKNWPSEASAIIATAGLQGSDANSRRNNQAEWIVTNLGALTNLSNQYAMDVNGTLQVTVDLLDGKGVSVTGGESNIYYEVEDTAIAEVSQTGLITGKAEGITTVRVYVISNNILDVVECELYVGDELSQIELLRYSDTIRHKKSFSGEMLDPVVVTAMGRRLEPTNLTYQVADTSVATVDENGFFKPVSIGNTTLTVTVTIEGETLSQTFSVVIEDVYVNLDGLNLHDVGEWFKSENADEWVKNEVTTWELTEDTKIHSYIQKYATYGGQKYSNEVLCFKLNMTSGSWPSIALRLPDTSTRLGTAESNGYLFCNTPSGLELHRFNNGVRTCIYGDNPVWAPNGGIAGHIINPSPIVYGQTHDIIVGAMDVEEGVRIILAVDGINIIDFIDTDEDAFTGDGYFGFVGGGQYFDLTKSGVPSSTEEPAEESTEANVAEYNED